MNAKLDKVEGPERMWLDNERGELDILEGQKSFIYK